MTFRTSVETPSLPRKITYEHKLMLVGSCFAESLAKRLQAQKFAVACNPFGVLYNPYSIAQNIRQMADRRLLSASDLRCENELWFACSHHSRFAHPNKDEALRRINESILRGAWQLRTADFLVLTLGTAWAYRLKETGETVANCHKMPAANFEHFFIAPNETAALLSEAVSRVQQINPDVFTIITVSPIRHLNDGAHGNQLSKAALLLGADNALQQMSNACYFPAYEIVLDELRDYRFYAADMLHPSEVASDFVCERFQQASMSSKTLSIANEMKALTAAVQHRPFQPQSQQYRDFCNAWLAKIAHLKQQFPHIDWSHEEEFFANA